MKQDKTVFPADSYRKTVIEPIFNIFKQHFYQEMMAINYAHAIMLNEAAIISRDEASALLRGLKKIEREINLAELKYSGEFEDLFFYLEKQLVAELGIAIAGKLHTGRSRNDMSITIYKMKVKELLQSFLEKLIGLTETLLQIAEENRATVIIAYTHGQPAMPTTYGHYLAALIEVLLRDLERLLASYRTTDKCSMGAAAITTSGFNLNRERVAELLGFEAVQENSYGCIAAVDYLGQVYSALKILFINLGRFIQDLGQLTGFDLAHLYVPNEFVQISSIMPQKRNPVPVEHLRVMSSITVGYCDTVLNSLHNTPFTDMNDAEDSLQMVGFKAFTEAEKVLHLITALLRGLAVNQDRIKEHIDSSFVTITELAETLVRKEGISFRQAHRLSSKLVKSLSGKNQRLSELKYGGFVDLFSEIIGREPELTEEELKTSLRPEYFVRIRNVYGGPGPDALQQALNGYYAELGQNKATVQAANSFRLQAGKKLQEIVNTYLG